MKLNEITPQSISKVSIKELFSIHRRIHQLSGVISKYPKSSKLAGLRKRLEEVHKILVNEMSKRKYKHQSNLTKVIEQYINFF